MYLEQFKYILIKDRKENKLDKYDYVAEMAEEIRQSNIIAIYISLLMTPHYCSVLVDGLTVWKKLNKCQCESIILIERRTKERRK